MLLIIELIPDICLKTHNNGDGIGGGPGRHRTELIFLENLGLSVHEQYAKDKKYRGFPVTI